MGKKLLNILAVFFLFFFYLKLVHFFENVFCLTKSCSDQIPDEAEHVEQQSHEHGGSQASPLRNFHSVKNLS
jgi:hypothetical protein